MDNDLWIEFASAKALCGLCGNHGVIDTRGITSAAGVECGVRAFCICPNGRALKEQGADLDRWHAAGGIRSERTRIAKLLGAELDAYDNGDSDDNGFIAAISGIAGQLEGEEDDSYAP